MFYWGKVLLEFSLDLIYNQLAGLLSLLVVALPDLVEFRVFVPVADQDFLIVTAAALKLLGCI